MARGNKFKPTVVAAAKTTAVAEVEAEVGVVDKAKEEVAAAAASPKKPQQKAVLVPLHEQKKKPAPAPTPAPPPPKKHSLPTVVAAPHTPAAAGANWAAMRAAKLVGSGNGGAVGGNRHFDGKRKREEAAANGSGDSNRDDPLRSFGGSSSSSRHRKGGAMATAAVARFCSPYSSTLSPPHRPGAIDGAATSTATRVLAVDCEMVGVGPGGIRSSLARVCIVNESGAVVLDTHVAQRERVTDHRTRVSGIRPEHLRDAPDAAEVRRRVGELIQGRILVGHAVSHDLKALMLGHPRAMLRDTAKYPPLMRSPGAPGRKPKARKLRDLASQHLGLVIQDGEHSPVDDARAALYLYQLHRKTWEAALKRPGGLRELQPPASDRKKRKRGGSGSGGGAQAALAKLAEQDDMVDL